MNPSEWNSLGTGLGGIFDYMNYQNPANSAMPYMNQIGPMMQGYMSPYINAGMGELPNLQKQYGQLTNNPGQVINQMGQGFQQSPGYQFQTNQAMGAANRAASAGGMLGSPMAQQNMAGTVNGMANQDYYNWMNHAMGAYGMGLQGEQGLYNTGYQASDSLSQSLAQALMGQANLGYAGAQNQNQNQGGAIGAITSMF